MNKENESFNEPQKPRLRKAGVSGWFLLIINILRNGFTI